MKQLPKALFFVGVLSFFFIGLTPTLSLGLNGGISLESLSVSAHPLMQVVISTVLLAACLFVILSKRYPAGDRHWAFATIGTIVGFWLPK